LARLFLQIGLRSVLRSGTQLPGAGCGTERHLSALLYELTPTELRPAIQHPNSSGPGSEEECMSTIVLTTKAQKLMRLCEIEGYKGPYDLFEAVASDSVCPAICMTEGCDHTAEMEPDQDEGYCEACGGNTMVSALRLANLI